MSDKKGYPFHVLYVYPHYVTVELEDAKRKTHNMDFVIDLWNKHDMSYPGVKGVLYIEHECDVAHMHLEVTQEGKEHLENERKKEKARRKKHGEESRKMFKKMAELFSEQDK